MKKEHRISIFFLMYNLVIYLIFKKTYPFVIESINSEELFTGIIISILYVGLMVLAIMFDVNYLFAKICEASDEHENEK